MRSFRFEEAASPASRASPEEPRSDEDEAPLPSPSGRKDVRRHSRRLRTQQQHADLVDKIEKGLSMALQEYRLHAEEVLSAHLEELETTEATHDLEVANLRAENARLRESLGLQGEDASPLYQTVALHPQASPFGVQRASTKTPKHVAAQGAASPLSSDGVVLSARRGAQARVPEQPGGVWQHFVAWVPNGAGLKQAEPWRPLPPEAQAQVPHRGSNALPTLPGMVPGSTEEKDGGESSSEASEEENRVQYEVLDVWKASQRQLSRMRKAANSVEHQSRCSSSTGGGSDRDPQEEEDDAFEEASSRGRCIVHPYSNKRAAWDVAGLFMVVYDMIMIPMNAFDLPESIFLTVMAWTTRIFWTVDMGWSCCTGIVEADGKIDFSFRNIVKRYLKTWFALDILIVSSDWMEELLSKASVVGLGRLARAFRIARVVRLLRLVRMQEVVANVTERVQSDNLAFILAVAKAVLFVVSISHVVACGWWGIGDRSSAAPWTWVAQESYDVKSLDQQYLVSMHWALSQFSGGRDEVAPANALERFYAVAAWVFGFTAAVIITSIMTSKLTQQHIIGGTQSRHLATLRKYLKQNHVSSNLSLRVQRSAQYAVSGDLSQDAVELLAVVSEPLKVEMHYEIYSASLRNHPFFSDYMEEDGQVMRRVCHIATSTLLLSKGDVVFSRGEAPRQPRMYFVVKGLVDYYCRGDTVAVGERQWISEAALWTTWVHRGTLTAVNDVKLAVLDTELFADIVHRFRGKRSFDPRLYAADFVDRLNKLPKVDDLAYMN